MSDGDKGRGRARHSLYLGLLGGLVGSLLTLFVLMLAAPQLVGERIVRHALLNRPDMLVEASDALRARQYKPLLDANRQAIETPFASSVAGADEKAEKLVTMAYFFDYACTFCKKSKPDIDRLLSEDESLRVVYRELPILGPASIAAARVSLAASEQGKFNAFYEALERKPKPNEETITQAAIEVGVLLPEQPSAAAEEELQRNLAIAERLGASGTPLFIIGDQVINSAVGYDALKAAVAKARDAQR